MSTSLDGASNCVKEFSVSFSSSLDPSHHKKFSVKTGQMRAVIEMALTRPWSPIVWLNNSRLKSAFKSCGIIALDIDCGFPLQDGKTWLKSLGLRSAILLTKSHQKIKASKAACDRFRIIIDAGQVFSLAQYEANMAHWLSLLPMADKSCKDGARFFFASPQLAYAQDGDTYRWQNLANEIEKEKNRLVDAACYRVARFKGVGAISEGLRNFILTPHPGSRHNACFWAACALDDLGIAESDMIRILSSSPFSELEVGFIERAIKNAMGRISRGENRQA